MDKDNQLARDIVAMLIRRMRQARDSMNRIYAMDFPSEYEHSLMIRSAAAHYYEIKNAAQHARNLYYGR